MRGRNNMRCLPDYKNPVTTRDNIKELQEILVQTCIDYMKKHNLTDIDEINFSVNGLSGDSYREGKWMPSTDSSIEVIGIEYEKFTLMNNGKEYETPVRKKIGEYC